MEDVRHLAQQADAVQAALDSCADKQPIQPADVAVLQDLQIEPLQFVDALGVRGGGEDPRAAFGMHLRGHGGEGVDTLDAQLLRVGDDPAAQGILADGRLGFAEKHHEIMRVRWVFP